MKIGISQRIDKIETYNELRDSIDQRIVSWIIDMGYLPILIPNSLVNISLADDKQLDLDQWINIMKIDVLILSGGNNIGEMTQRDLTEKCLLHWAEINKIPVLGICRGMQMMGVYADVALKDVDNHVRKRHRLVFNANEENFPGTVNSYHNQTLSNCPEGYEILATSEDGCIEAMAHKDLPWEGWMWHPERETSVSDIEIERFRKLIHFGR